METIDQAMARIENQARIVYVIAEADTKCYKIGISKNMNSLGRRLQNLQTGNPRQLSIVHTVEFTEDGKAYQVEQASIKALAFYQFGLTGDWFMMPNLMDLYTAIGAAI